ncbi:MAG: hypothetical protein BGN88_14260 [Clostridiales bacterium 43-6]|nr:MAG: hypothetical protein BGN88_14260 [Clostridiales bacterium 43-6]
MDAKKVKLIFNPGSGVNNESPLQLMEVLQVLQQFQMTAEPFIIQKGCDIAGEIRKTLKDGIDTVLVCGGDGTVSSAAKAMIDTELTMGIIPTGTRNNIARSLNIPLDIQNALNVIQTGKTKKIDMGICICNQISTPFIELCSVGLFSTLFEAGDAIQHGNITKIGDFITALASTAPSEIHLLLDRDREIIEVGHNILFTNMPYVGLNFKVGKTGCFADGKLDVLYCSDLTKMDLIGFAVKGGSIDDARIKRFHIKTAEIHTNPPMPIMADGETIGEGSASITIKPQALRLIYRPNPVRKTLKAGDMLEK